MILNIISSGGLMLEGSSHGLRLNLEQRHTET